MRPVINVTTRKDSDLQKLIMTRCPFLQNSLSIFLKQLITKSKRHQIKSMLKKKTCN